MAQPQRSSLLIMAVLALAAFVATTNGPAPALMLLALAGLGSIPLLLRRSFGRAADREEPHSTSSGGVSILSGAAPP